jgi:hypothetical protein
MEILSYRCHKASACTGKAMHIAPLDNLSFVRSFMDHLATVGTGVGTGVGTAVGTGVGTGVGAGVGTGVVTIAGVGAGVVTAGCVGAAVAVTVGLVVVNKSSIALAVFLLFLPLWLCFFPLFLLSLRCLFEDCL